MTITAAELDTLIEEKQEAEEDNAESIFYDYPNLWDALKWGELELPYVLSDSVFITSVADQYGGEGKGDDYWVVVNVTTPHGTQLFRRNGWYASYSGGELDGPTEEVVPVEKIVTTYEVKE